MGQTFRRFISTSSVAHLVTLCQKTIPLCEETTLIYFIMSTKHAWPQLLNNLELFPLLAIKKSKVYQNFMLILNKHDIF